MISRKGGESHAARPEATGKLSPVRGAQDFSRGAGTMSKCFRKGSRRHAEGIQWEEINFNFVSIIQN